LALQVSPCVLNRPSWWTLDQSLTSNQTLSSATHYYCVYCQETPEFPVFASTLSLLPFLISPPHYTDHQLCTDTTWGLSWWPDQ
jgi:hypothetical protein